MLLRAILSAWWGYAIAAVYGIPLLFMWRARHDRKVVRKRRELTWLREAGWELGIGDEALVSRAYGTQPNLKEKAWK